MDAYGLVESVHAVITGIDTAASSKYREELRSWRQNDLAWRAEVREHQLAIQSFRADRHVWRQQDLKQRTLDNARVLWGKAMAANYRQVHETTDKLRTVSELGALVAGFAVLAVLDFQFPGRQQGPALWAFCLCASLTVALELVAVVVCTLLMVALPRMARSSSHDDEEEAAFFAASLAFASDPRPGQRPPRPAASLLRQWDLSCELPWHLAALAFLSGFPLLALSLALAGYLKFKSVPAALVCVAVVPLVGLLYSVATNHHLLRLMLVPRAEGNTTSQGEAAALLASGGLPFSWHSVPDDTAWPPPSPAAPHHPPADLWDDAASARSTDPV